MEQQLWTHKHKYDSKRTINWFIVLFLATWCRRNDFKYNFFGVDLTKWKLFQTNWNQIFTLSVCCLVLSRCHTVGFMGFLLPKNSCVLLSAATHSATDSYLCLWLHIKTSIDEGRFDAILRLDIGGFSHRQLNSIKWLGWLESGWID